MKRVMRIAAIESVSGSPHPGSVFQNVHWDVPREMGAKMITVNFALIDVPDRRSVCPVSFFACRDERHTILCDIPLLCSIFPRERSFGPFEIWPSTQNLHPEQIFANPTPYAHARGGDFQCFKCYEEIHALTRLWPSYVLLTQLGDAIIRNPATWHRGTQHKAAKPRHMVAFNFRRKSN